MIGVVDYGVCNIGSVLNMLQKVGASAAAVGTGAEVAQFDRLILPGVGSFDHGVRELRTRGLWDSLRERVLDQDIPLLGICLGMQLMFSSSEEGDCPGLGLIRGDVRRFDAAYGQNTLKIPHMGWNSVIARGNHAIWRDAHSEARFYFVHSFFCDPADPGDVAGTTDYGIRFCSVVARNNIVGVQFHPEKSHVFGMQLLANFASMS